MQDYVRGLVGPVGRKTSWQLTEYAERLTACCKAERRIGRRLPELLRRLYTEVADGGFGPDGGLAYLTDGIRAPEHLRDWPCGASVHERQPGRGISPSWLLLTYGGCTTE
jgi:hypothetical protein